MQRRHSSVCHCCPSCASVVTDICWLDWPGQVQLQLTRLASAVAGQPGSRYIGCCAASAGSLGIICCGRGSAGSMATTAGAKPAAGGWPPPGAPAWMAGSVTTMIAESCLPKPSAAACCLRRRFMTSSAAATRTNADTTAPTMMPAVLGVELDEGDPPQLDVLRHLVVA